MEACLRPEVSWRLIKGNYQAENETYLSVLWVYLDNDDNVLSYVRGAFNKFPDFFYCTGL